MAPELMHHDGLTLLIRLTVLFQPIRDGLLGQRSLGDLYDKIERARRRDMEFRCRITIFCSR